MAAARACAFAAANRYTPGKTKMERSQPFEDVFFLLKMVDFAFVMLVISGEKTGVIFHPRGMKTTYTNILKLTLFLRPKKAASLSGSRYCLAIGRAEEAVYYVHSVIPSSQEVNGVKPGSLHWWYIYNHSIGNIYHL